MYQNCLKRLLAIVLSLMGIVALGWLLALLSIAVKLDSPGPVLFKQKRVGRFLRKTSLDELPQLFNILLGHMSIVGPRPALWNQFDLIAERDKYGANDVRPGLTGWAQINGRDELEIDVKARLDGEYVQNLSFAFDVKCFLGTIRAVLSRDGVVEGGTGAIQK